MLKNKTFRFHRPELELRRDGQMLDLPLEGGPVPCAFPLILKVTGREWAVGFPMAQLRAPEVDVYVFAARKDGESYALSPAPAEGFDALTEALTSELS